MWTRTFWKLLTENVIGAAAAAGSAYLLTTQVPDLLAFNWRALGSMMVLGGLAAFLAGLGKNRLGTAGTPSLVKVPAPVLVAAPVAEQRRTQHTDAPDWDA